MPLTRFRSSPTLTNTALAATLAAVIAWLGPPGTDLAAHLFQLNVYLQHGFELWTNYWYAGRYTFVGYSLLYYPLAALLGIKLLAVISVAAAAGAFTLVVRQTWGEATVWAGRFFALVAAASVVSAAFPYGLGLALALCALVALARRRLVAFALSRRSRSRRARSRSSSCSSCSPRSASRGRARDRASRRRSPARSARVGLISGGSSRTRGLFPFATGELLAALIFCGLGAALTWRVERARVLKVLFVAYGGVCVLAYLIPSDLGENVVRLRYAALPLAALTLSLRRWRPLPVAVVAFALAASWNISPLAYSLSRSTHDPSASAAYWAPVVQFLHSSLPPTYRVEAVGTADHWEAVYLPQAGIPIVRGWFRQDDFPQNEVLYDKLDPQRRTSTWLRRPERPLRRPHRRARRLQREGRGRAAPSGRSGLPVVFELRARDRVPGAVALRRS